MDKPTTPNTMKEVRLEVDQLLKRLIERAAKEYERQAAELLLAADAVRKSRP